MFFILPDIYYVVLISGIFNVAKYAIRYVISFFYNPKIWEALEDKYVVVTGATREIGQEICRQLAYKDIKLIMIDDNRKALQQLKESLGSNIKIEYYVSKSKSEKINYNNYSFLEEYKIGLLINAANTVDQGIESFVNRRDDLIIDTNIITTTHITHRVIAQMVKNRFGYVVFIGDTAFGLPFPYCSVYSATLAYLHQLASSLYYEMKRYDIVVEYVRHGNILCPENGKNDRIRHFNTKTFVKYFLKTFGSSRHVIPQILHVIIFCFISYVPKSIMGYIILDKNQKFCDNKSMQQEKNK